jgi:hypothetical protein
VTKKATHRHVVGQAMTVYYRWALPDGLSDDTGAAALNRLFELLRSCDGDAADKVFTAAISQRDFPADIAARYPTLEYRDLHPGEDE